jgi:hypothetical protein
LLTDSVKFTGKEKQGKTTQEFKFTIAVKIKVTKSRLVTPCRLVEGYQIFGSMFSLHLQDILKKVAVLSPLNTR